MKKSAYTARIALIFGLLSVLNPIFGQNRITPQQYIEMYKETAILNMQQKRIPASITLAQGMLESGNGNSQLARRANNHFGIKCHDWTGPSVRMDDDKRNECFRKYKNVLDSYRDHADFLAGRPRYAKLFELDITDYKGWARELQRAGYATNPRYAQKLIDLIERHDLQRFDKAGATGSVRLADVQTLNRRKVIIVQEGDSKASLAAALNIRERRIEQFNELGSGDRLYPGQTIFLEKKRRRTPRGQEYHTVKPDDTMYDISQQYGLRYRVLLRKNDMWYGSKIKPGDLIHLRKRKSGGLF